jgi:hypothetical protein
MTNSNYADTLRKFNADVKAEGGYIVAPGSVIDGNEYRRSHGRPLPRIADLPPASEALKIVATSRKATESRAARPDHTGTTVPHARHDARVPPNAVQLARSNPRSPLRRGPAFVLGSGRGFADTPASSNAFDVGLTVH